MKICYITDAALPYSCGGSEKRLYEISERMKAKGHDVTIVCLKDKMHFTGERRSILHGLKFAWQVFNHLRKNKYDYIEAYQSPLLHIPVIWLMKHGAKFNLSWFEVWKSYWKTYSGPIVGRIGMLLEKLALNSSDVIIVPSEQTVQDVKSVVRNKPIYLVHNGINWQKIQSIKPFKERYDIIDCCRLIRGKNVDLVIKAASKIKGCKVLIIGDGPERKNLEKLARDLKVDVTFKGRVESDDDVIRYIKSAKIFVHPSIQEGGSSITLFEANACGVPVVTIYSSLGIDESLMKSNNGIMTNDFDGFCNAVKMLLDGKSRWFRNQFGAMPDCARRFAKQFDWKNVMKQYEKAIE